MALRKARVALILLVFLPVLGFVVERLVVTDAEAIERLVQRAVGAVENRDFVTLRDCLDEEFASSGRDRDETARYVEEQVRRYQPGRVSIDVRGLSVEGDQARAVLQVRVRGLHQLRVDVPATFRKGPEGWRILTAQEGTRSFGPDWRPDR